MKKIFVILLAAALLLTGCERPGHADPTAAPTDSPDVKPVTFSFKCHPTECDENAGGWYTPDADDALLAEYYDDRNQSEAFLEDTLTFRGAEVLRVNAVSYDKIDLACDWALTLLYTKKYKSPAQMLYNLSLRSEKMTDGLREKLNAEGYFSAYADSMMRDEISTSVVERENISTLPVVTHYSGRDNEAFLGIVIPLKLEFGAISADKCFPQFVLNKNMERRIGFDGYGKVLSAAELWVEVLVSSGGEIGGWKIFWKKLDNGTRTAGRLTPQGLKAGQEPSLLPLRPDETVGYTPDEILRDLKQKEQVEAACDSALEILFSLSYRKDNRSLLNALAALCTDELAARITGKADEFTKKLETYQVSMERDIYHIMNPQHTSAFNDYPCFKETSAGTVVLTGRTLLAKSGSQLFNEMIGLGEDGQGLTVNFYFTVSDDECRIAFITWEPYEVDHDKAAQMWAGTYEPPIYEDEYDENNDPMQG